MKKVKKNLPADQRRAVTVEAVIQLAAEKGLSIKDYMARNDAYTYFQQVDALIRTGPTRTNVNDFRAILILES